MPAAEMQSFRATTPDLLRGERGWMSQIKTAAPGGGREMFLTSPFIDQAISLRTLNEHNSDITTVDKSLGSPISKTHSAVGGSKRVPDSAIASHTPRFYSPCGPSRLFPSW